MSILSVTLMYQPDGYINPPLPPTHTAVMRKFNHPHIIKLFGVMSHEQATYIVMELAPLGQVSSVSMVTQFEATLHAYYYITSSILIA